MHFFIPPIMKRAMADLFADQQVPSREVETPAANAPLADRLRPTSLDEVVGQDHLTGPEGAIGRMVASGRLASMILWGPPGTGKTTIARLLAGAVGLRFVAISAVFSGVADLKKCSLKPEQLLARVSRPCCSWMRSIVSIVRSRMASSPLWKTAPSRWSERRPRTRASRSTQRFCHAARC